MAAEILDGFRRLSLSVTSDDDDPLDLERWLSVEISVRDQRRAWSAVDSCLTEPEIEALIAWMKAPEGRLTFKEPNLAFEMQDNLLLVDLDLEFAPEDELDVYRLELTTTEAERREFSRALREELDTAHTREDPRSGL